jgi:hypothetical protein
MSKLKEPVSLILKFRGLLDPEAHFAESTYNL